VIVFITTYGHEYSVASLVTQRFGVPVPETHVMLYDKLLHADALPLATYIFTDIERLYPWERRLAGEIFRQFSDSGVRCLNDPAAVKTRYPLVRALAAAGINPYTAYRGDEDPRPERFPVFLRFEHEHSGPLTGLIRSQADLDLRLSRLVEQGVPLEGTLVVEYAGRQAAPGIWARYATFRVGETLSAFGVLVKNSWNVKNGDLPTGELAKVAESFARDNLVPPILGAAFETARIDYGRVDHGKVEGRDVVFEINTNPHLEALSFDRGQAFDEVRRLSRQRLADALFAIDTPRGGKIEISAGERIREHRERNPVGQLAKRP
jgi:hypothetical protein